MLPLLALLSIGMHANWKRGRLRDKQRTLLVTFVAAAVLALRRGLRDLLGVRTC